MKQSTIAMVWVLSYVLLFIGGVVLVYHNQIGGLLMMAGAVALIHFEYTQLLKRREK